MVSLQQLSATIQAKEELLNSLKRDFTKSSRELNDLEKLNLYVNSVLSNKLKEVKTQLEPLINSLYKVIFKDDDLEFEISSDQKWGKTTYAVNIINKTSGVQGTDSAHGGAVVSLTSVILRILFIILTDKRRVLFLDETLNQVSEKYREQSSQFLAKLCEELQFTIVVITFDEGGLFSSHADTVYEVYKQSKTSTGYKKIL